MTDDILETTEGSPGDSFLLEEYRKEIPRQADRMDDLAKELFKAELAIPGVYIAVLKLYSGGGGGFSVWVAAAFACWALALAATLYGLFPKKYDVLEGTVERVRESFRQKTLTIDEYFSRVAEFKRSVLVLSSILFFAGLVLAAISIW